VLAQPFDGLLAESFGSSLGRVDSHVSSVLARLVVGLETTDVP
jgi:hypothetical protein